MSYIARITRDKLYEFINPTFVSYHTIRQIMDDQPLVHRLTVRGISGISTNREKRAFKN